MQDIIFTVKQAYSFTSICEIDDYISFIWTKRYFKTGDFELVVPVRDKYIKSLIGGYHISYSLDDRLGIIEKVELKAEEDGRQTLIVSGRFLESLLARRITGRQWQTSGLPEKIIGSLVDKSCINPFSGANNQDNAISSLRVFPDLSLLQVTRTAEINSLYSSVKLDKQYTGKNVLEEIESLAETYQIGFKLILTEYNKLQFSCFFGEDKSGKDLSKPFIEFSDNMDNLKTSDFLLDTKERANAVMIAGEGEGNLRRIYWNSQGNPSGYERYEVFVDSRNTSSNDNVISESDYKNMLMSEAKEHFKDITKGFNAEVDFSTYKYREEVDIGDLVYISKESWGIAQTARVVEVIESMDSSGTYTIVPTFLMQ